MANRALKVMSGPTGSQRPSTSALVGAVMGSRHTKSAPAGEYTCTVPVVVVHPENEASTAASQRQFPIVRKLVEVVEHPDFAAHPATSVVLPEPAGATTRVNGP